MGADFWPEDCIYSGVKVCTQTQHSATVELRDVHKLIVSSIPNIEIVYLVDRTIKHLVKLGITHYHRTQNTSLVEHRLRICTHVYIITYGLDV